MTLSDLRAQVVSGCVFVALALVLFLAYAVWGLCYIGGAAVSGFRSGARR